MAIGAGPHAVFVGEEGADRIAGQAVGGGEGDKALLSELQQTGAVGAEPQVALAVLVEGLDASSATARAKGFEAAVRVAGHGIFGTDPKRVLAVLEEAEHTVGGQTVGLGFPDECARWRENAKRACGGYVNGAAGGSAEGANRSARGWGLCCCRRADWDGRKRAGTVVKQ